MAACNQPGCGGVDHRGLCHKCPHDGGTTFGAIAWEETPCARCQAGDSREQGHGRERFERELARMRAYAVAAVVVEAPKSALRSGAYRGSLDPKSGEQTVLAFGQRYGVAWHWCTDKADAERTTFDILRHFARDRWKELQALTREWQESEHATT